jgi:hypothetical protein
METLNNVHWLANGNRTTVGDMDHVVRVTGFGKVYSKNTFEGRYSKRSKRHYTRAEFEKACSSGPTDILMLHEPPENEWTRRLIFAVRPALIIHSNHTTIGAPYECMGIPTVSLSAGEFRRVKYTKVSGFKVF